MEFLTKKMNSATNGGGSKKKLPTRKLGKFLKEQRARLYIIRRCVALLLCSDDDHDS